MAARGSRQHLQRIVAEWLTRQAYEYTVACNRQDALLFDWRERRAQVERGLAQWSLNELKQRARLAEREFSTLPRGAHRKALTWDDIELVEAVLHRRNKGLSERGACAIVAKQRKISAATLTKRYRDIVKRLLAAEEMAAAPRPRRIYGARED